MDTTETAVDTQSSAPASAAPDTAAQPTPGTAGTDTASLADKGTVMDAGSASAAPDTQTADPETAAATATEAQLLAGKFKTQDDLVKSYKEAERKLGEFSRYKQEADALREQVAALGRQATGSREPAAQQTWQDTWMGHPLSQRPNPLTEGPKHKDWMEEVFTPHFVNDPAGTIAHFALPLVEQLRESFLQELNQREQAAKMESSISGFFGKPAPWSGEKPVTDALKSLPNQEQVMSDYKGLLDQSVPPDVAAELVYRRHSVAGVQAESQALKARDADVRRLAAGAPSRGAGEVDPGVVVGDGTTLEEMMASSAKKAGFDLGDLPPRAKYRLNK